MSGRKEIKKGGGILLLEIKADVLTNIWVLSNDRSRTLPPIPVDLVSNIFTFKKTSKYICDISENGVGKPKRDRNSKCTFIAQLRGSSL